MRVAATDQAAAPLLRELARVVTVRALRQGADSVPAGSVGTIVHVYPRGEAFEVEFSAPIQTVLLARPDDLEPK